MVVLVFSIVLLLVGLYFLLRYTFPATADKVDTLDSLIVYDESIHNKSDYYVLYDPIYKDGKGNITVNRRASLIIDHLTLTEYNNGEVATVKLPLDVDYLLPEDLVTIDDKVNLQIVSSARRNGVHFYYIAAPLQRLTKHDFYFVNMGVKVYRLNRKLTDAESKYVYTNKLDVEAASYKSRAVAKPFNPPRPYASTSNHNSRPSDIIDDLLYNPLLNPISPISIWNSDDDGSSSKWHSSSSQDNDSSSSSSSSWDSSSSYDSGSSDSGGSSDCGGGGD